MSSGLEKTIADARTWLVETALPFWLETGFDASRRLFHERLDLDGRPIETLARRLMVQSRQIYVFAHASVLGWCDARDIVSAAFSNMVAGYFEPDGRAGWIFSLQPGGKIADGRRDLYTHSFVLLACAWVFRLTGNAFAIEIADRTLVILDREFPAVSGGYRDDAAGPDATLRQNPHMHLFESLLALFEVTGVPEYLQRADRIRALLQRFFIPGPDILAEYFDANWKPNGLKGQDASAVLWEPGHHCEWVWLLDRYATYRQRGADPIAAALYDRAYKDGINKEGTIADEMNGGGGIIKPTHRAWPLTEAIKANVVRYHAGDANAAVRMKAAMTTLCRHFLRHNGTWMDQFDGSWKPMIDYVPASTLYHIFLAIAEAESTFSQA